jgi:hypothetical protein
MSTTNDLDMLSELQADVDALGWEMTAIFLDRATYEMLISKGRIVFLYASMHALLDGVPVAGLPLYGPHLSYSLARKESTQ